MLNDLSFTGGSSPLIAPQNDFGPIGAQPDVPFASAMSPDYGSTNASSPFYPDEPVGLRQVSWGSILGGEKDEPLFGHREPECALTLGPMLSMKMLKGTGDSMSKTSCAVPAHQHMTCKIRTRYTQT